MLKMINLMLYVTFPSKGNMQLRGSCFIKKEEEDASSFSLSCSLQAQSFHLTSELSPSSKLWGQSETPTIYMGPTKTSFFCIKISGKSRTLHANKNKKKLLMKPNYILYFTDTPCTEKKYTDAPVYRKGKMAGSF